MKEGVILILSYVGCVVFISFVISEIFCEDKDV